MNFEDIKSLYEEYKKKYGKDTYKKIFQIFRNRKSYLRPAKSQLNASESSTITFLKYSIL